MNAASRDFKSCVAASTRFQSSVSRPSRVLLKLSKCQRSISAAISAWRWSSGAMIAPGVAGAFCSGIDWLLWENDLHWHDQECVAVEVTRVLQSLAINLAMVGCAIQRVSPQHKVAPGQREGSIESVHHAVEQSGADNAWILGIEINEQFDFDDALRKGSLAPGVCFLTALEKKASGPAHRGNVAPKLEAPRWSKRPGICTGDDIHERANGALAWCHRHPASLNAKMLESISSLVDRGSTRRQRFQDSLFEA